VNDYGLPADMAQETLNAADFVLESAAAVTVAITWLEITGGTKDPVDNTITGATETEGSTTASAVQEIIGPRHNQWIEQGAFAPGDCIFYFSRDLDLSGKERLTFTDAAGQTWIPDTDPPRAAAHYMRAALLASQIWQPILARAG